MKTTNASSLPRRLALLLIAGLFAVISASSDAQAQYSYTSRTGASLYSATRNYLYNRPTVSPYLNLTTLNTGTGVSNYFTLVRPQVEEQQQMQMRQQQQANIQRQIADVQDQVRQTQQQNQGMAITGQQGWSARGYPRFGLYLSFYPGMNQIAARRPR
jgi:hypothetical protein